MSNSDLSSFLLKKMMSAILETFFIESTSEFQTLVNENIKWEYSYSLLDRNEYFGTKSIVLFYNFSFFYLDSPVSVLEDRSAMQRHRMCK